MKNSDNLVVVPLKSSDQEYSNVIKRFHDETSLRNMEIVRVRNAFLAKADKNVLDYVRFTIIIKIT